MNKLWLTGAAIVAALAVGFIMGRGSDPSDAGSDASVADAGEREILYWVAPMDANYRRDEPGKSPMGMDLVPVFADEVDGQPGVVSIDPTIVNNLGVRTASAQRSELPRRIDTVGYVEFDEDTVQHVHTRVEGWVEKLATKATGDTVETGQLLFELYSPTLVNAQEEYLTAVRSGNEQLIAASAERLSSLGVGRSEIDRLRQEQSVRRLIRFYSEVDGVISHLGVREGIYVTPAIEIMSIAELDKVWVLAEVFERQSAWVRAGQPASVRLDFMPGVEFDGVVDYVYPELNPTSRTLTVRIRFDNVGQALRPNMFAQVTIAAEGFGEVVHVPREAVIRGGSVDRVVIALGNGRFRAQPVSLGIESGDRIAIRRGVSEGDDVVISGQFLIDSESNIDSALRRMEESE